MCYIQESGFRENKLGDLIYKKEMIDYLYDEAK